MSALPRGNGGPGTGGPAIKRRTLLKAAGASAAGAVLFTTPASATDDTAFFDVECSDDTVRVTLTGVDKFGDRPVVDPTELEDLRVFFGTKENVDLNDNGSVDRKHETIPCLERTKPDCSPVAFPTSTEVVGSDVVYTFGRADAGLDAVTSPTTVVLAGVYVDEDDGRDPPSLDGEATFDPTDCPRGEVLDALAT